MAAPKKTTRAVAAKAVKEEAKRVEEKAEAVKSVPVAEKEVKAPAPEKEAKVLTAKKPAAKKDPKATVVFQFAGKEIVAKDVLSQAQEDYAKAHKDTEIKTIELYIVAEEHAAYYVVNGEESPEFKIML